MYVSSCLFLFILPFYLGTSTLKLHTAMPIVSEEFVSVDISIPTLAKIRTKRSGKILPPEQPPAGSNLLPSKLNISFILAGKPIVLSLVKNTKLDNTPIPIQTTMSDNSIGFHHLSSVKFVGAYYHSKDNTVNIHLECMSNTSSTCTHYNVFGSFEHDADLHLIEPTIQPVDLGEVDSLHRIVKPMTNPGFLFDHLPLLNDFPSMATAPPIVTKNPTNSVGEENETVTAPPINQPDRPEDRESTVPVFNPKEDNRQISRNDFPEVHENQFPTRPLSPTPSDVSGNHAKSILDLPSEHGVKKLFTDPKTESLKTNNGQIPGRHFYPTFQMKGIRHFGRFENFDENGEPVDESKNKKETSLHSEMKDTFVDPFLRDHPDKHITDTLGKTHTRKKRATGRYLVEVYIVIDYLIYNFWLQEENYDEDKAMQRIRQYYVFLINGVDNRYRNMQASFRIEVTLIGIYVAKTKSDLTYLENNAVCSSSTSCVVDANKAVAGVRQWVQQKSIPQYDHIMTFTRYDMRNDAFDTAGTAFLNSVCSNRSHSLVEERFDFIAATVAAHEIGHALGAVHDGDNNACSKDQHNIMSSISSANQKPYNKSPWEFSSCTVREIGLFLDELNKGTSPHCMQQTHPNAKSFSSDLQTKLGQIFNIDRQCEFIAGKGSYACRSFIGNGNFEDICTGLWCKTLDPFSSNCVLALPAEGTSCGSSKLCNGYSCEFDSSAPRGDSDSCIFGDGPGIIWNGLACSDLISKEPYQCYSESIRKSCCGSCNKIKSSNPDCEYGDKSLDCVGVVTRGLCSLYAKECCKSCA